MSNLRDKKRILGDLRIFQAVHNDLKLSHQEVTLEDGSKTWAYVYEGVDPYELEDSHFPSIIKAVEAVRIEAREAAILDIQAHVNGYLLPFDAITRKQFEKIVEDRLATLKGVKE